MSYQGVSQVPPKAHFHSLGWSYSGSIRTRNESLASDGETARTSSTSDWGTSKPGRPSPDSGEKPSEPGITLSAPPKLFSWNWALVRPSLLQALEIQTFGLP